MVNRYSGEIHINPMRVLRNDDFNNDGKINDIAATLKQVISLNQKVSDRMQRLMDWLAKENTAAAPQFHYADGGYIAIQGLSDKQLLQLASKGLIELFDNATSKEWVMKYGHYFGLVWEDGRAVEI